MGMKEHLNSGGQEVKGQGQTGLR